MSDKMSTWAEKFLWANFKMYLMQYPSCLLDNILKVDDVKSDDPMTRYHDFMNEFSKHIGLGSYVVEQAAQFSDYPYVTVHFAPIDLDGCSTRVVIGFDIVWVTDLPKNEHILQETGNSAEAVATFRASIMSGLDELMYKAFDGVAYKNQYIRQAFFDRLRDQTIPSPVDKNKTKLWKYNIIGTVDDEKTITEVTQLKREDRPSAISVFHVVYKMDINKLYGDGIDCGC